MKRQFILSLSTVAGCVLLSACGDDVTRIANGNSAMEVVASADSLGKCDSSTLGKTVFASDENAAYVCADSGWVSLVQRASDGKDGKSCIAEILSDSTGYKVICGDDSVGVIRNGKNGSDGKDGLDGTSCLVKTLSDSSGYKVVCDGDSIGVIRNGANGSDGKDGLDGMDGSGCSLADNGDGTVTQVCGEDTVTLYKALCGGAAYDPARKFCVEEKAYDLCDGKIYDPFERFCRADTLYELCGGAAYDPARKFCVEEKAYDLCDGKTYDPFERFCHADTLYELCGEKVYDPSMEFCDFRDANVYGYVVIGEQAWMAENLNFDYNEGTAKSYCYDDNADSCAVYGRLYTWSAAMDSAARFSEDGKGCGFSSADLLCDQSHETVRGVCPEDWHLSSDEEWNTLVAYVAKNTTGGKDFVGYALKSASGWDNDGNGSDAFGFGAIPGGVYGSNSFYGRGTLAYYWSSSQCSPENSRVFWLYHNYAYLNISEFGKLNAYSIRCVKD